MRKLIIGMAALACLAIPALAGEYGGCQSCTKTVSFSTTVTATKQGGGDRDAKGCWGMIGNWVNAATQHCPDRGYGPQNGERSFTAVGEREIEVPCPPKERRSRRG